MKKNSFLLLIVFCTVIPQQTFSADYFEEPDCCCYAALFCLVFSSWTLPSQPRPQNPQNNPNNHHPHQKIQ